MLRYLSLNLPRNSLGAFEQIFQRVDRQIVDFDGGRVIPPLTNLGRGLDIFASQPLGLERSRNIRRDRLAARAAPTASRS